MLTMLFLNALMCTSLLIMSRTGVCKHGLPAGAFADWLLKNIVGEGETPRFKKNRKGEGGSVWDVQV